MSIRRVAASLSFAGSLSLLALACGAPPDAAGVAPADEKATTEALLPGHGDPASTCTTGACIEGERWSAELCECVPACERQVRCINGSHWDAEKCRCEANCYQQVRCVNGSRWDASVCHCVKAPGSGPSPLATSGGGGVAAGGGAVGAGAAAAGSD
jgi:hypothetical protein